MLRSLARRVVREAQQLAVPRVPHRRDGRIAVGSHGRQVPEQRAGEQVLVVGRNFRHVTDNVVGPERDSGLTTCLFKFEYLFIQT